MTEGLKSRVVLFTFEQQNFAPVGILQQLIGMPLVAEQVHILLLVQIVYIDKPVPEGDILALLFVGGPQLLMVELLGCADAILPVIVSSNGKDILYAPATCYVGSCFGTHLQLLLDVVNNPRIIDFRISRYNFMACADLIGLVFTCV